MRCLVFKVTVDMGRGEQERGKSKHKKLIVFTKLSWFSEMNALPIATSLWLVSRILKKLILIFAIVLSLFLWRIRFLKVFTILEVLPIQ